MHKIIQLAPMRTASTLLANALYGMVKGWEDKPIQYVTGADRGRDVRSKPFHDHDIIKTHNHPPSMGHTNYMGGTGQDPDWWINNFPEYDIRFVCCERKGLDSSHLNPRDQTDRLDYGLLPKKYGDYENVYIMQYEDLIKPVEEFCGKLYKDMKEFLPMWELSLQGAVDRCNKMNARYEEIKDKPFTFLDKFYYIHGSHRGRGK